MSSTHSHVRASQALKVLAVLCVVVALAAQGVAATLVNMLGASHSHKDVEAAALAQDPMYGWQDFRRTNHVMDATLRPHVHTHSHALWERHHHDSSDVTVVLHDRTSEGDDAAMDAGAGGTGVALALAASMRLPVRAMRAVGDAWVSSPVRRWTSTIAARLERPPMT